MNQDEIRMALEARIIQLRQAEQDKLAELGMISGALRESQYWLERLTQGEAPASPDISGQLSDIMPGAKFEPA